MTTIIETLPGDDFQTIADKAKRCTSFHHDAKFDFNGITCLVNIDTNVDYLFRDYKNAWLMGWKEIGEYSHLESYPSEVEKELFIKQEKRKEEDAAELEMLMDEYIKKKDGLYEKISTHPFICTNKEVWESYKTKNTDPYGQGIISYAEQWARLMQYEISNGKDIKSIAEQSSFEADTDGITGFMYGSAVKVLSDCWEHGEKLREWHNEKYDYIGEGAVNPAALTIK